MKYYAYVDESGRDPFTLCFIVCVVLVGRERQELAQALLMLEKQSGKGEKKWHKANNKKRQAYIDLISTESRLKGKLFYVTYDADTDYLNHTADAIAKTIRRKAASHITIFIDGFRKSELAKLKKQLRPSVNVRVTVKTIMRGQSNPMIRLADALCGLVRDAGEGSKWAMKATIALQRKGYLIER